MCSIALSQRCTFPLQWVSRGPREGRGPVTTRPRMLLVKVSSTQGSRNVLRRNKWLGLGAAAISLGLAVSACGTTDDKSGDSGDSKGLTANIGVLGALSGANASVVIPSVNGAQLALDEWSAEHPDFHIKL